MCIIYFLLMLSYIDVLIHTSIYKLTNTNDNELFSINPIKLHWYFNHTIVLIIVSLCYRGIGCGILLWLCFWWSCMAIVYSWQPCMDWWWRGPSSYWALLLVTGWTKTPDWKVNMAKLQIQSMQNYCATWHIAESISSHLIMAIIPTCFTESEFLSQFKLHRRL